MPRHFPHTASGFRAKLPWLATGVCDGILVPASLQHGILERRTICTMGIILVIILLAHLWLACSAMTSDLGGKPHVPLLSGLKQPRPVKLPLKARNFLSFDISQTSPSLCRLQLLVLLRRRACNEFEMSELCCPGESINIVNSQLAPQEAPAPTLLRTIAHTGSHFVLEIPSPIPGIRFALSAHETGIPI